MCKNNITEHQHVKYSVMTNMYSSMWGIDPVKSHFINSKGWGTMMCTMYPLFVMFLRYCNRVGISICRWIRFGASVASNKIACILCVRLNGGPSGQRAGDYHGKKISRFLEVPWVYKRVVVSLALVA